MLETLKQHILCQPLGSPRLLTTNVIGTNIGLAIMAYGFSGLDSPPIILTSRTIMETEYG